MMDQVIPDIPRIYTALAEWLACLIYMIPLRKRKQGFWQIGCGVLAFVLLMGTQIIAGKLSITFWIPGMLTAMLIMYFYFYINCDITLIDAGYFFARAFIVAEFAASLVWQMDYYLLFKNGYHSALLSYVVLILSYGIVFAGVYFLDPHHMAKHGKPGITIRELGSAVLMTFATFLISNIHFLFQEVQMGNSFGTGILYIRTLVDFSGMTILFTQQKQRNEMQLKKELEAMNSVLHRQYEQYKQSRENIEMLNVKYHDLKHMIGVIRSESNPEKQESYLQELDEIIKIYETQYNTGNSVLDAVLTSKGTYCAKHDIKLTCMVDGSMADRMSVMDICTVFGNALDNAIESVIKLSDMEKKVIRVSVFHQNNFLMMRFENYYEEALVFEDGLPATTKKKQGYHGYGIKSIRRSAEKYGGNVTIHTENNWFTMLVLIPFAVDQERGNI